MALLDKLGGPFKWLGRVLDRSTRNQAVYLASLSLAKWLALKALIVTIVFVGLYVVFHNFLVYFMDEALTAMHDRVDQEIVDYGGISYFTMLIELTGVGAWLGSKLKVVEAFTVLMVGVTFRAIRDFIPFI